MSDLNHQRAIEYLEGESFKFLSALGIEPLEQILIHRTPKESPLTGADPYYYGPLLLVSHAGMNCS